MSYRPGRSGQPWTPQEDTKLLSLLKEGKSARVIASVLERTPYAIQCRIEGMVVDSFNKDVSLDDISLALGVSKEEIDLIMKDHHKKEENKKKKEEAKKGSYYERESLDLLRNIDEKLSLLLNAMNSKNGVVLEENTMNKHNHTENKSLEETPKEKKEE